MRNHVHTRREFLQGAVAAGVITAVSRLPAGETTPARKTSFVVVMCDDLGYSDLGCFGHPVIKTPHLDRFAQEGLRLTDCYASAPVCSPSRCGMLTGRIPHRYGIYDWIPANSPMHLPRTEITVARMLQQAGYATCLVGKWHCNGKFNSPEQPQPGDAGFDHWMATQNNARPSHRNPDNFVRNGTPVGPLEGFSSHIVVDEAIRWLKSLEAGKPFCLFVWFHEPHEPIAADKVYTDMYPKAETPEQAAYFGDVTQMDAAFGRLMAALDEMNRRNDTLVMFTSDNGPETLKRYPTAARSYGSPGPLRGMKLWLYEGGMRVPGIIRWPGRTRPGQTSSEPVANLDVLPTFCEIAGVPVRHNIDGASVLNIFDGKPVQRATPLYWQYRTALGPNKVAMRDGDWKLLARADLKTFELYNLREDPSESRDLAEKDPDRVRSMAERLTALHADINRNPVIWKK